jgi:hypothetical protein
LDLQTLVSQPIVPKNLPKHWSRMVTVFWTLDPISFEHVSSWHLFLETTPNHIPLGIQKCPIKTSNQTELDTSTLSSWHWI